MDELNRYDSVDEDHVVVKEQVFSVDSLMGAPSTDLGPLAEPDTKLVEEFDGAWAEFIQQNPSLVPEGKKTLRLKDLQNQVNKSLEHKEEVESELESQLAFFHKAFKTLEETAQKEMEATVQHQKAVREHLKKHLDNVAVSAHVMSQTIPWNHFLAALEQETASSSRPAAGKSVKPPARALKLIESSGNAVDDEARAYQVTNVLLKTQIKMLEAELDRFEKTAETSKVVGQLLTELNIWGLLTPTVPGMQSQF